MSAAVDLAVAEAARALPGVALAGDPAGQGVPCRWLGRIGFAEALALQEAIAREHARYGDLLLLLEHDPVYTTGRGGRAENHAALVAGAVPGGTEVLRIGRGGDVTYHGPGQLVGYALVDVRARGGDVHRFLRDLEAGVIATVAALGVPAMRWRGKTGVWVGEPRAAGALDDEDMRRGRIRKIASIGIAVRRGIAMHGFALNVDLDLAPFAAIVPCGLGGVHMTSLARERAAGAPPLAAVAALAARHVGAALAAPAAPAARPARGCA